jgi:hypothetical protein
MARMSRSARIVAGATAIFGDRWQSPLARATKENDYRDKGGLSQSLLTKLTSAVDPRAVTDEVYQVVADTLMAEAKRVRKGANKAEEMAGMMYEELEK